MELRWLREVVDVTKHAAAKIPLAERSAYATVVASMAAADDVLADAELARLQKLGAELGLDARAEAEMLAAARRRNPSGLAAALEQLQESDLRFTLYTDCLHLAFADEEVVASEERTLAEIASALRLTPAQVEALHDCVAALHHAHANPSDANHEKKGQELAARLTAVGVPVGAVALASAAGLSAAGVSTGVAALVAGLGIATGFGAVLGLGVGTVLGVRWLGQRYAARHAEPERKRYQAQNSTQTLREGLAEFRSGFANVIDDAHMSSEEAKRLFHCHDLCHVVFGCDTTVGNEGMVDVWSIFGSDIGLDDYRRFVKLPEGQAALKGAGITRALLESIQASPKLFDAFMRAREMKKKWPFHDPDAYLDRPLVEIREEFNIHVV